MSAESTTAKPATRKYKIDFDYCFKIFLGSFAVIFAYTFVRYNLYKNVEFYHIPVYVFNKAMAVNGTFLICLSYLIGPLAKAWPERFRKWTLRRASLGVMGFAAMLVHACWSLMTLNPQIHAKFYDAKGALSPLAEWSFFFATIGTVHLMLLAIISIPVIAQSMDGKQWKKIQESGLIAMFFAFGHLVAMGSAGWFDLDKWGAPLPPTTLVSAMIITSMFVGRQLISAYGLKIRPWIRSFSSPAAKPDVSAAETLKAAEQLLNTEVTKPAVREASKTDAKENL